MNIDQISFLVLCNFQIIRL